MRKVTENIVQPGLRRTGIDLATATEFPCSVCGETKPIDRTGAGTGYGHTNEGALICYACCATQDIQQMQDKGKIGLYITRAFGAETEKRVSNGHGTWLKRGWLDATSWEVTNWPGSLRFRVGCIKRSTGYGMGYSYPRLDVWFDGPGPDGPRVWHGFNSGHNNEILHCRITKRRAQTRVWPALPPNTTPGILP